MESTPFQFDPFNFALIMLAAILASSLSELISYFLLYRKEEYRLNKCSPAPIQPRWRSSTRSLRS